jgi:type VI secretion system Hcp family effector
MAQHMAPQAKTLGMTIAGMIVVAMSMMSPGQRVAIAADAALTATVLIEGVQGTQGDGSIPILSFQAGITRSPSPGPAGSGGSTQPPQFSGVTITKVLDETSPLLSLTAAMGKRIKTVELAFYDEAQHRYFEILLEDALISSVQTIDGVVGTRPVEAVTFTFSRIVWTAFPTGAKSSPIVGGWDLRSNSAL